MEGDSPQIETTTIERLTDTVWKDGKGETFDDFLTRMGTGRWRYCGPHPFKESHFIFQRTMDS